MPFERWIIETLVSWGLGPWFPHLALFAALIGLRLLPTLLEWLGLLLAAFVRLFFAALLAILPAAAIGLGGALSVLLSISARGALLVWFIALEAVRGETRDEDENIFGPEPATELSGIAEACALLGLPEGGFTPDDLKRAYRRAIKQAHPDQGGSAADTRAILNARDRINKHFGWS